MKDQLNRTISLAITPKRIVSLVPSQTELLVDLGLKDDLVGITKFCVHPKELRKEKQVVGGTKQIHVHKIKDLQPDIILCNKEENTREMIAELEQIAPVHISDIYDIDDNLELITMYGELFDVSQRANVIIEEISKQREAFNDFVFHQPKRKVVYFIWKNPWMVAADQTFINELLSVNNFENIYQDQQRYPEIELLELKERQPNIILLSSEPYPFKKEDMEIFKSVCPNTKVIIVDGEAFSWYGSRLLKTFDYFKTLPQIIEH